MRSCVSELCPGRLLFDISTLEYETNTWPRNVGYQLPSCAASDVRRTETSTAPLRKPKNSQEIQTYIFSWFQAFAVFCMLYAFFWVITRRLKFICRLFGTLCLFQQSVPKRRHINSRRRVITQKKAHSIFLFDWSRAHEQLNSCTSIIELSWWLWIGMTVADFNVTPGIWKQGKDKITKVSQVT